MLHSKLYPKTRFNIKLNNSIIMYSHSCCSKPVEHKRRHLNLLRSFPINNNHMKTLWFVHFIILCKSTFKNSLMILSWSLKCSKTEIWIAFKMSMSRMLPIKDFHKNMYENHLYHSSQSIHQWMMCSNAHLCVCVCVLMNT